MGLRAAWNALFRSTESIAPRTIVVREPEADELAQAETLGELSQQVHAHHAEITQLRLEWAETLDKFTAWSNRQAARDRVRMKRAMASMEDSDDEAPPSPSPQPELQLSGHPEAPNGMRHPKADLYARIRRQ